MCEGVCKKNGWRGQGEKQGGGRLLLLEGVGGKLA